MIVFPNCKINLGLYITGKRADGYHNIETIFLPLPFYDVLELMDAQKTGITVFGNTIPGRPEDNIVLKAWRLLKKKFPILPPVHFCLLKNIPAGAGLGAGSANGAFTLIALNEKYQLRLSADQLMHYALQLGSDCPFFIFNKATFASGRGEIFNAIDLDISAYKIVIVNPGIHIATPWAFSQAKPAKVPHNLKHIIKEDIIYWKKMITNNFEYPVFLQYPEIEAIKNTLYANGASFALMSGSGSTVYGLFKKSISPEFNFPENYFVRTIPL
ncbi:MAG: 4-(cytidine 5'-diphospho)-2-C-methyl-D-erythritol kinase [Niabella sp.]